MMVGMPEAAVISTAFTRLMPPLMRGTDTAMPSGIPTILGALLGYLLGEIGALGLALSLGFASGAMLYVVFGEILPQAILMYHSKLPAFSAIIGMLVGLFIIFY